MNYTPPQKPKDVPPGSKRAAAWDDIEERCRKDPNWNSSGDPTYHGPYPAFLEMMKTDAELENLMAGPERRRMQARQPQPLPEVRPPQPLYWSTWTTPTFGLRLRRLREARGWTQEMAAELLGVSRRTVIRYEQGRTLCPQTGPLVALQRLESASAAGLSPRPSGCFIYPRGLYKAPS